MVEVTCTREVKKNKELFKEFEAAGHDNENTKFIQTGKKRG